MKDAIELLKPYNNVITSFSSNRLHHAHMFQLQKIPLLRCERAASLREEL